MDAVHDRHRRYAELYADSVIKKSRFKGLSEYQRRDVRDVIVLAIFAGALAELDTE